MPWDADNNRFRDAMPTSPSGTGIHERRQGTAAQGATKPGSEAYSLYAAGKREECNAVAGRKCATDTVEGVGVGL